MIDLKPLVDQFIGSSGQLSIAPSQQVSWQDELMKTIDPERERRKNIAQALLSASAALASTPGNFLQGLSSAAVQGATAYNQGRDAIDQRRTAGLRMIDQDRQQQEDRRLEQLYRTFGIADRYNDSERAAANDQRDFNYRKGRDEKQDAFTEKRIAIADRNAASRAGIPKGLNFATGENLKMRKYAQLGLNRNDFFDDAEKAAAQAEYDAYAEMVDQEVARGRSGESKPTPAPTVQNPDQGILPNQSGTPEKTGALKTPPQDVLMQAEEAIRRGADPAAVRQRLIDNGYDGDYVNFTGPPA